MFCQSCGKEIPEGAFVCIHCGTKAPVAEAVRAKAPTVPGKGLGIASMILGILSIVGLCCTAVGGAPFSIAGLVTGIIGMKQAKESGLKNGMALAGVICSVISLALLLVGAVLYILYVFGLLGLAAMSGSY